MFTGQPGKAAAALLVEFDQLTNARKLEHMDDDCFSQTAFGDEAAARMHRYEYICSELEKIMRTCRSRRRMPFPDDIDEGAGSLFLQMACIIMQIAAVFA